MKQERGNKKQKEHNRNKREETKTRKGTIGIKRVIRRKKNRNKGVVRCRRPNKKKCKNSGESASLADGAFLKVGRSFGNVINLILIDAV